MKVLLVNYYDGKGGAAIACKRLHLALLERGFDVKMLVLETQISTIQTFPFFKKATLITRIVRKIKRYVYTRLYNRPYKNRPQEYSLHTPARSFVDITEHELYAWADVVNLHWVSNFLDFPSFFSSKQSKPIIWTMHDMNPFTGGCHYAEACDGFKANCSNCPQLSAPHKNYNQKNLVIKGASDFKNLSIVSPSIWLKEQSESSYLFKQQKHFVIPNGLDTAIFKVYDKLFCQSLFDVPKDKKTVLFVAQAVSNRVKGFKYLMEALSLMKDDITILVIGEGTLENQLKEVMYLGSIQDERLLALAYNTADVFVLPSLADNLPNVIVESLCCGTPVVSFEVGGIPDLIENGVNGFLAQAANAASLAEKLTTALNFDWKRQEISASARKKYDRNVQVDAYISLFEVTKIPTFN
jgi:glycosyltransferase involved in cell wall biosynthesis